MDNFSFLNTAHATFFADLYDQYLQDPDSLEPSWKAFFQGYDFANSDFLYDLHVLATILSVSILIITIFEALLLERHSINLKKGLSESSLRTPIESQFKFLLKVLGIGLIVLVFALATGFLIYSDPDIESRIKILLSCLALAIYISVYIAMKYSKLSAKYALRFLLITFLLKLNESSEIPSSLIFNSTLPLNKNFFRRLLISNSCLYKVGGNDIFESKYRLFNVLNSMLISKSSILKDFDPYPVID